MKRSSSHRMDLKSGVKLGPYEILSPLGKGGMGEVWKARDSRLNRDVAIKFSIQQFSDRFAREARAIAALNHRTSARCTTSARITWSWNTSKDLRSTVGFPSIRL